MKWFEAMIPDLVQGLTEFLPESSSGHTEIAKSLYGVNSDSGFYFTVAAPGAIVLNSLNVSLNKIFAIILN